MIREHNITWFLSKPERLMKMKPFTRGGKMEGHGYESSEIQNNTMIHPGFANLTLKPISQDTFITEYRPELHHIIMNRSIPHIKVALNVCELHLGIHDMTQTASFQKLIHSAHVRSLTANGLEFILVKKDATEGGIDLFESVKDE